MKHISIILVSYCPSDYIKKDFFDTILENSEVSGFKKSFIIFDNGSPEEQRKLIQKKYPQIDLIASFRNEGYCRAVNLALKYAYKKYKSDYFVITDQDAIATKNYLFSLINFMKNHKNAGFVQPLIFQTRNKKEIYSAGHSYTKKGMCFPLKKIKKINCSKILSGSILFSILESESLKKVGLLDERFWLYYESNDWGFRFREAGFDNYCVYTSRVFHERELKDSSPFRLYFVFRNKLLFWKKHDTKKFKIYLKDYKKRLQKLKIMLKKEKNQKNAILLSEYVAIKDAIFMTSVRENYSAPNLGDIDKFNYMIYSKKKKFF